MVVNSNTGNIRLNGVPYKLYKDPETSEYAYARKSVPRYKMKFTSPNASASDNNLVDYAYSAEQGYGDAVQTRNLNRYHYAGNLYMSHENEAVVLPDFAQVFWNQAGIIQTTASQAAATFELIINENDGNKLVTYVLQDCRAGYIDTAATGTVQVTVQKVFEAQCTPTDAIVVDNNAYVAMGSNFRHLTIISQANSGGFPLLTTGYVDDSGSTFIPVEHRYSAGDLIRIANCNNTSYNGIWKVSATGLTTTSFRVDALAHAALPVGTNITGTTYKIDKRYVRKFDGGVWSRDDNNYIAITAAAAGSAGTGTLFTTSTNHLYTVGTKVYLVNMSVAGYNSMSTADVSTIYTITEVPAPNQFEIEAITYSATATGHVNAQDSDIHAEHFCFAGDLLIRGYKDATIGWSTSRADPIDSNPLLDANWTAGIGTIGVGDANSPITDLVAIGDGEIVMKAEGVYTYKREQTAFTNEIPELNEHRHTQNGKNSCEHKGWVYIPTTIGLLRYRNGQTYNVTPGRGGQQKYMSPVLPIAGVIGDAERLYAITSPFRNYVRKDLDAIIGRTKIYVDYNNDGSADPFPASSQWSVDHDVDLNTLTTSGYIYFGCTQPWHSVYIEMDDLKNSVNYGSTYSGLRLANSTSSAQYWDGANWADRTLASGGISGGGALTQQAADFTRTRISSANQPSAFGRSGELVFFGTVPSNWVAGGTTPLGVNLGTTSDMYWTRIKLSANINDSIIIKRIIAGVHDPNEAAPYDNVDSGAAQFVIAMTEEQGKGPVWHTLWEINPVAFGTVSELQTNTAAGNWGSALGQTGVLSVVQPNILRSGLTGQRYLLAGNDAISVFPLGNKQDITEDGVYGLTNDYNPAILVLPETDCGLPTIDKELREIDFDVRDIALSNIFIWWKVDGGAWQGGVSPTSLPAKLSALNNNVAVTGQRFATAIKVTPSTGVGQFDYPYAPRFTSMPVLRVAPRPEMAEYIEMSLVLDADTGLPGGIDRREQRTAYAALKTLLEATASVEFVDVDNVTDRVHAVTLDKKLIHSSNQQAKAIANITLSVVT